MLAAADEAFAAGDVAQAAQAYGHVLQDEPGHPKAVAGLARCYLKSGDLERAQDDACSSSVPTAPSDEAMRAVEAELKLREQRGARRAATTRRCARSSRPIRRIIRRATTLRWRSTPRATAKARSTQLLEIVRRDRKWNEEAARKHLVTLFEAMGPTDPRTLDARRKLSSILFS